MTRYRKTANTSDRVGRDVIPTATPSPTASTRSKNDISSAIDSKVSATMPDFADLVVDVTIDDFIDTLSDAQLRAIGEVLRNARYSIKKVQDVKDILSGELAFEDADLRSFGRFVAALNNQLIFKPSAGTGPKESAAITKYGPEQIDSWVDNWLTTEAGRTAESITPEQAKILRKAVKDYASSESVTTVTKDAKGRAVTTYKPGMSEAGIASTLQTAAAEAGLTPDIERRQAFEFGDILNKTLGVGGI